MKLYIYDHCPFCNRVRIAKTLLNISDLEEITLQNDDVDTPTKLVGKKLLPILVKKDGEAMGESLDIIEYLNSIATCKLETKKDEFIDNWMSEFQPLAMRLVIPVVAKVPFAEFKTQAAIDFFVAGKTKKFGNLEELITKRSEILAEIKPLFAKLEEHLQKNKVLDKLKDNKYSVSEVNLYAFLRFTTAVKGVEYPPQIKEFMKILAQRSKLQSLDNLAV